MYGGAPPGNKQTGPGRRQGQVLVYPPGEAGGAGPGGRFTPRSPRAGPTRLRAAAPRGSREKSAPHILKRKESSHPPRIKEKTTKKTPTAEKTSGCFPSHLSLTWGRSPQSTPRYTPKPQAAAPTTPRGCRAGFLATHHLLFIGKSEWSHFVAYASRVYL